MELMVKIRKRLRNFELAADFMVRDEVFALLGASGIVFMLIMLASLSGFSGGIPVTMLLVAALYLGQQVYDIIFAHDNVANFMHIVGGVCGTAFGYVYAMLPRKRRRPAARKKR